MQMVSEEMRLRALQDLDLLDTPNSEGFDRITRMASQLFDMPISCMSLTDRDRQWFKSRVGVGLPEIPRLGAPCAVIAQTCVPLLVPNLCEDERFATSPLVQAGLKFYAGAPLVTREGGGLGSLCVLDSTPRTLSTAQMVSLQDFAAMVMAQIELQHNFGRIDPPTGLPNRHQMVEDLQDDARRGGSADRVALMIETTDTRRFNHIVSVLGTSHIDELLAAVSRPIRGTLKRDAKLYRIGVAALATVIDEADGVGWRDVVARISETLRHPIWCGGVPIVVSAVFGVSPFRLGEVTPADALRTALSAVSDAREAGVEHALYDPASDGANRRRHMLLADMRQALTASDQLSLAYQPRVDARSGGIVGAEALLRWRHPSLGNVSPGEFIPLVEQTALARPVTAWVIDAALDQIAEWRRIGCPLRVSVNVSAHNLEEDDFAQRLAEALDRRGLAADVLELEFTESAVIRNGETVLEQLGRIRAMGVEIAIDDFGTGYSTFAYLKDIPASTVKLDQSFIRNVVHNERDQLLVLSMIRMAHGLGYRCVAEGVETADVRDFLADAGCDELQGYLIARPMPASALQEMVRRSQLAPVG